MTERRGATRRISKRTFLLVVLIAVSALAGLATAYYVKRTDPALAEGILARLEVPAEWQLADSEVYREVLLQSRVTRYYLVKGAPDPVAAAAHAMLSNAGFAVERMGSGPDCTSNHEPPQTFCSLLIAPPSDHLWQMLLVVFDRRGAAYLNTAPWFVSSSQDQIVVRITVEY